LNPEYDVDAPSGANFLTILLIDSATNRFPKMSKARPPGYSAKAFTRIDDVTPAGVTFFIDSVPSVVKVLPDASTAMADGSNAA
jgi:hypothetical protein